ncbi:leucine-rich repeat containing protein [Thecamonas trahens ATCC 50062]|uniref:Leucine-rich repeat containing protein n=1 Tax=Thecamonas trahens ATCC 50062 TaxID=461836 RepID=A0A0L0DN89_THETB|nr:leucine-rich repeat containing protein [Thecamonas trahens ATCC 50062]KNC53777.1 leucine-rich repeat containing protein [Thecamonas trahens ATCC 50062]|eukprot:XP_013754339.1 leucine-rich repeat containing protein [Thecamonas trahens ATCC 50062]
MGNSHSDALSRAAETLHLDLAALNLETLPRKAVRKSNLTASLTSANVARNRLGVFPWELVAAASSLVSLDLQHNDVAMVLPPPADFAAHTALTHLNLTRNKLAAVGVGTLEIVFPALVELLMGSNRLTQVGFLQTRSSSSLSTSWSHTLKILDLSHNSIRALPDLAQPLPELQVLNLGHNHLEVLPGGWIGTMRSLHTLRLEANEIVAVPDDLEAVGGSLAVLVLSRNRLTEFDVDLGVFATLLELRLDLNFLDQPPRTLGAAPLLTVVTLAGNPLKGGVASLAKEDPTDGRSRTPRKHRPSDSPPTNGPHASSGSSPFAHSASARNLSLSTTSSALQGLTPTAASPNEVDFAPAGSSKHGSRNPGTASSGRQRASSISARTGGFTDEPDSPPIAATSHTTTKSAYTYTGLSRKTSMPNLNAAGKVARSSHPNRRPRRRRRRANKALPFTQLSMARCGLERLELSGLPRLSHWAALRVLDLTRNALTTLPSQLHHLHTLEYLNVSHNALTALPACLGSLPSLTAVIASFNNLNDAGLPIELFCSDTLERLSLDYNRLTALPDAPASAHDLPELPNLITLAISGNALTTLPAWAAGGLPELKVFRASSNSLDAIPRPLYDCLSLEVLELSNNAITKIDGSLTRLHMLRELNLSGNPLRILPDALAEIKRVQHVAARFCPHLSVIHPRVATMLRGSTVSLCVDGCPRLELSRRMSVGELPAWRAAFLSHSHAVVLPPPEDGSPSARGVCSDVGIADMVGDRPYMEDVCHIELLEVPERGSVYSYLGVFDGHGGRLTAVWLGSNFHRILAARLREAAVSEEEAMRLAFGDAVEALSDMRDGAAAVVALWASDRIILGNVGDSRAVAVLSDDTPDYAASSFKESYGTLDKFHRPTHASRMVRDPRVVRLSIDHNVGKLPYDEYDRIRAAGGFVTPDGYVNDSINLARSLGDSLNVSTICTEPHVVSVPSLHVEALIMGSDGVWDVIDDVSAAAVVRAPSAALKSALELALELRDKAYRANSTDNITALVALSRPLVLESDESCSESGELDELAAAAAAESDVARSPTAPLAIPPRRRMRRRRRPRPDESHSDDDESSSRSTEGMMTPRSLRVPRPDPTLSPMTPSSPLPAHIRTALADLDTTITSGHFTSDFHTDTTETTDDDWSSS